MMKKKPHHKKEVWIKKKKEGRTSVRRHTIINIEKEPKKKSFLNV
jgi:hypothetical protein